MNAPLRVPTSTRTLLITQSPFDFIAVLTTLISRHDAHPSLTLARESRRSTETAYFLRQKIGECDGRRIFPVRSHDLYSHRQAGRGPADRRNRCRATGQSGRRNPIEKVQITSWTD